MYEYKGKIRKIIDGDSLIIDVDVGFRTTQTITFRLKGINTPELVGEHKAEALKAKAFVQKTCPMGTSVNLKTYKDQKEKYGRYLADVYLPWSDKTLNQQLLDEGLAEPYDGGERA